MTDTRIVGGYVSITLEIPFAVDVFWPDFLEWGGNPESFDDLLEFLKASPDWWADLHMANPDVNSHEVIDYEILRVTETRPGQTPVPEDGVPGA